MKLYNLKDHNEQVSFAQAVTQGLGKHQGLFFPHDLPEFSLTEIDDMLAQDFVTRSAKILSAFIGDEIPQDVLQQRVRAAFAFPASVSKVQEDVGCLELFHGPTLAFKDFGGRFMAQMLTHIAGDKPVTILTATSGDTGAAVAHAFYGLPNVKVVILYPRGKISPLQEKLFCTLGGNIETVAIDGDFDACQALVKQAFDDEELKATLGLNSANSINISRLLAQICYYFEAAAQLPVCWPSRWGCRSSALSPPPTPTTPFRAICRAASGRQKPPRRRCPTPWTSASRTTGRALKSCSAVKSGVSASWAMPRSMMRPPKQRCAS